MARNPQTLTCVLGNGIHPDLGKNSIWKDASPPQCGRSPVPMQGRISMSLKPVEIPTGFAGIKSDKKMTLTIVYDSGKG